MEIELAVLATSASAGENGKMDIGGIFSEYAPADLESACPPFRVVVSLLVPIAEWGVAHTCAASLIDQDGRPVRPAETLSFTVPHAARPRPQRVYLYSDFEGVVFPAPGDYQVEVVVDGRTLRSIPLEVILDPEAV